MPKRWLGLLAAGVLLAGFACARAEVAVPPLKTRVTDLTGTLSAQQIRDLESRLNAFERSKGSQIAVLMLPTTAPETIEEYSIRVADAWQTRRARADNGVHRTIDLQTIFLLFVALVVTDAIFRRLFGRVIGAGISGGIVGAIVWLAAGVVAFAVIGGLIGFVVALVNGLGGRRGNWASGGWSGGGWSGGGGFGGGGGGFSGGGGGFSGGGASGSW